jgi:hypothetical protein
MYSFVLKPNNRNQCRSSACYPGFNMQDSKTRQIAFSHILAIHVHCRTCRKVIFVEQNYWRTSKAKTRGNRNKAFCENCIRKLYQ